jgi:hypothetical protein
VQHSHTVNTLPGKQLKLFIERGEQKRLEIGIDKLPRMYVERHHRGLTVALRRLTDNLREQRAMASVYAIEETNRGNLAHGWHF